MNPPKLSICIPTWNRCEYLRGLLQVLMVEISKLPDPTCIEVCVSDNASTDNTPEVCREFESYIVKCSRSPENIGLGNFKRVVEMASGEYVWMMGDDDYPVSGGVKSVLKQLESGSDWYIQTALIQAQDGGFSKGEWTDHKFTKHPVVLDRLGMHVYLSASKSLCAMAGLIGCLVGRREYLVDGFNATKEWGNSTDYPHVAALAWAIINRGEASLETGHEPTFVYCQGNDRGYSDPWERIMIDLEGWVMIGAKLGIGSEWATPLRRHHGLHTLLTLSLLRGERGNSWPRAEEALLNAGYHPDVVELAGIIPYRVMAVKK